MDWLSAPDHDGYWLVVEPRRQAEGPGLSSRLRQPWASVVRVEGGAWTWADHTGDASALRSSRAHRWHWLAGLDAWEELQGVEGWSV